MFNIPDRITVGDTVEWSEPSREYNPATDTLSCFVRGQSALDLTGVPTSGSWYFAIDTNQSALLIPGLYKAQFVVYQGGTKRKTLGTTDVLVCPSFENLTEFETRSDDEIELIELNKALSKGITEYRIGDRMVKYHSLTELSDRQKYLIRRIAIATGKMKPGGRNIGIRFNG